MDPKDQSYHPPTPPAHRGAQNVEVTWDTRYKVDEAIPIPRHIFEKVYLNPPVDVKGDFRNILANPTPLGLVGFLTTALPLSFQLMNVGGAGGDGGNAATLGFTVFFGGVLQLIAAVMEWFLGNTFSFLVFGTFGAGLLSLAAPNLPAFNLQNYVATHAVTPMALTAAEQAAIEREYYSSMAFGILTFGLLTTTYGFCALRTNIIFVAVFFLATTAVLTLAGSYWAIAEGNTGAAARMQKAVGAILLVCCVAGWYLLVAALLEVLEFGYALPVGDLSEKLGKKWGKPPSYKDRSKSV
ncbi:transcriptional activator of ethanol catabolism AlcS [Teratosphaeria destructans]|uniref:Transcriptional activator of ethanol catabolism AlcS n=1 Tax=Teratosphaeria destructans TaxID=418781 RepID=A0A9W7W746_9PEZI|nr:transcriptional activator of ethanol catabolism AlcS [Teratosphaeria destructans]